MDKPIITLKIDLFADGRILLTREGNMDSQLINVGLLDAAKDIMKKQYAESATLIQPVRRVG